MNFPYLIICCIIWSWTPFLSAATSLCNSTGSTLHHQVPYPKLQEQQINHNTSAVNQGNGTTDPRPWRGTRLSQHRHLRTVHGTLNIIGWGVLTPIGIIAARYMRKLSNDDWYTCHVLSHFSGFLLGTLGWGLGISMKNTAKEHTMSTHGIIGTVIFAFATLQVPLIMIQLLAICLQPDEEHGWRRCWVVYHNVAGYALIVVIIANIFEGINNIQSSDRRWDWIYGCVLGVLGVSTLALEVLRWVVM